MLAWASAADAGAGAWWQTLREVERQHLRENLGKDDKGMDVHYLKNVILKLYEIGAR